MTLWLNRAGSHGEYEQKFLDDNRIYCTWDGLNYDLGKLEKRAELVPVLQKFYPKWSPGATRNYTGQVWSFAHDMKPGDWVVLPSKKKAAIHIAEITGGYTFDAQGVDPYYHYREVKWLATDIPRTKFDQDILLSLGAFLTICEIKRNDAEKRVRAMAAKGWTSGAAPGKPEPKPGEAGVGPEGVDLEQIARDQIAKLIMAKFKSHGMAVLVEAILKAQGYTTFRSPEGPDKGVDILAAPGLLGFDRPRIAVQVKSQDAPLDRPTLDQLIGTMQNVQADQGLLVCWGGFRSSVDRETAHHFFRVRLWDQTALIEQLLGQYDKLDEDLRAELPLKRIWTVAAQEEEE